MSSIVVSELKGSLLRHRFLDRLAGRIDVVAPEALAPGLAQRIGRFLIAGLDDTREPGTAGLPVFTGGRYVKLCFSASFAANKGSKAYRLPVSMDGYTDYVAQITGFGPNDYDDLFRIYRFHPPEIFDHCRDMRADCPAAWRSLLSNEFGLAQRLWPALGAVPRSQFRHPLVDAFRILAEFERGQLITRHLARARAILDRPRLLAALASPGPLIARFPPYERLEVCRWIEYACLSSKALSDILFHRSEAEILKLPAGYPFWALARGQMIGGAADYMDDPQVREALIAVFSKPTLAMPGGMAAAAAASDGGSPVERRRDLLRNDEVLRFYGLTGGVLPIVTLDDVRRRFPTSRTRNIPGAPRRRTLIENSRPVLTRLGSALRRRADPVMQSALEHASDTYLKNSKLASSRTTSLEANIKLGMGLALLYLPQPGMLGAAARFDPAIWKTPRADAELYSMLLDPRRGGKLHRFDHPQRRQLRVVAGIVRRAYGPFLRGLVWSNEVERVICDLACALGPISVDPQIGFAIRILAKSPKLQQRLGIPKRRRGFGRR